MYCISCFFCFNTIQYDIDLKRYQTIDKRKECFNTIQYDIDLKQIKRRIINKLCFNTIQYDIDLKLPYSFIMSQ